MESLSIGLSSSPISLKSPKFHKIKTPKSIFLFTSCKLTLNSINFTKKGPKSTNIQLKINPQFLKAQSLSFLFLGLQFPLSSSASEELQIPTNQDSSKINLEAIVVSIDDFFNKYPFFVAGVVFIWLFVIPVTEEYLRKYKFISAINAFKKLKEDPNAQLLDIRDYKTLRILGSPNLKILNKNVSQIEYLDGNDEAFVTKVKEDFKDPANTTICILDNFDGDSMKVAELLFKNGFKEAYAIRGGVRGTNGWLEIQETLLPPSVHIYPKKKVKKSTQANNNGAIEQQSEVKKSTQANNNGAIEQQSEVKSQSTSEPETKQTNNGYVNISTEPNTSTRSTLRSSSPYPMYPDMKPPSSPTPSKPE